MPAIIVCLICDSRKTLIRLRPYKVYACTDCVKQHGGVDAMLRYVPRYVQEFKYRHDPALKSIVGAAS